MKKIISCLIFGIITWSMVVNINYVVTPKAPNRYFMLDHYLEQEDIDYDVQVFGSCHAYTSFNPICLEEQTGIAAFVYANAGEIIPSTYLRMLETFKQYTPQVAVVEIWGINAYDTYDIPENIFGQYLENNVEQRQMSWERFEVIKEYDLDWFEMNFPIGKYKDRLMDGSMTPIDFRYSFEDTKGLSEDYVYAEMETRFQYNGYMRRDSMAVEDYPELQSSIEAEDYLEIEADIVKYVEKIIQLCDAYDVELVFYRAPYISNENELKKVRHFTDICETYDVVFYDLEKEIDYDYTTDFMDYEHLSESGANKSTEFLTSIILEKMEN